MNKASGGDEIPVELFQLLKDDAVKVLYSVSANLENSAVATGLERSVFIPIPKKGSAKECSNLPHNCTYLLRLYSNAQNSPSLASATREP